MVASAVRHLVPRFARQSALVFLMFEHRNQRRLNTSQNCFSTRMQMMITIYGVAPSRTFRSLWMLEELDLTYERNLAHWDDDGPQRAQYLELNPNGRVPCLVDDGLVLFESLAINLYLMRRYGGALAPASIEDEGRTLQWSFWAVNELEPLITAIATEKSYKAEEDWDRAMLEQSEMELKKPLDILNRVLTDRTYILGSAFSAADLNVVSVMFPAVLNGLDLSPFPNVQAWYERCATRDAPQRIFEWAQAELASETN